MRNLLRRSHSYEKKAPAMKKKRRLPSIVRIIKQQDGQLNIVGMGKWYSYWRDPYHLLLTIPWSGFLALTVLGYLVANTLFALAYLAGGDGIEKARPGNFFDAFFFSQLNYIFYNPCNCSICRNN